MLLIKVSVDEPSKPDLDLNFEWWPIATYLEKSKYLNFFSLMSKFAMGGVEMYVSTTAEVERIHSLASPWAALQLSHSDGNARRELKRVWKW